MRTVPVGTLRLTTVHSAHAQRPCTNVSKIADTNDGRPKKTRGKSGGMARTTRSLESSSSVIGSKLALPKNILRTRPSCLASPHEEHPSIQGRDPGDNTGPRATLALPKVRLHRLRISSQLSLSILPQKHNCLNQV